MSVSVKYMLQKSYLFDTFLDPENSNKETFIVDYIAKRLNKCDLERRYCNRFLSGFGEIVSLRATLQIYDDNSLIEEIEADLSESGYPVAGRTLRDLAQWFDGKSLKNYYENAASAAKVN